MESQSSSMWIRVRSDRTAWREVDGEIALLDLGSSTYFGLNAAGSVLWPALVEGTTHDALVNRLTDAFDIPLEQAGRDVGTFLEACCARGLLEI